jgi:hypothetical protein
MNVPCFVQDSLTKAQNLLHESHFVAQVDQRETPDPLFHVGLEQGVNAIQTVWTPDRSRLAGPSQSKGCVPSRQAIDS